MINKQSSRKDVLATVKEDGGALEYASEELRADREVVLAAIKENGIALKYASKELQADSEMIVISEENFSWTKTYNFY